MFVSRLVLRLHDLESSGQGRLRQKIRRWQGSVRLGVIARLHALDSPNLLNVLRHMLADHKEIEAHSLSGAVGARRIVVSRSDTTVVEIFLHFAVRGEGVTPRWRVYGKVLVPPQRMPHCVKDSISHRALVSPSRGVQGCILRPLSKCGIRSRSSDCRAQARG